jgi:pimeloyl-ACP methyl ester carboxylesterase
MTATVHRELTMTRPAVAVSLLGFILLAAACTDREQPLAPPQAARAAWTPADGSREVVGVTGEGALYGLYVPAEWNGSLVVYAHGIVAGTSLDLEPSDTRAIRVALNDLGYAVAYSSYSENGWAVIDGITRTHQLTGLFKSHFQRPARVYLVGRSMGSLVALNLAERHPAQYDGVLVRCGFLAGVQGLMDHIMNVRLLFDFYYPGVLPGEPTEAPVIGNSQLVGLATAAMQGDATGATLLAEAMAAIGMPLAVVPGDEVATLQGSILTALGLLNGGYAGILERTHGHLAFDNMATDYVIPAVQAGMPRYRGDPDALNWARRAYQPTGRLAIPMVAVDIAWDNQAPTFHRDSYEQLLAGTGAAELLHRLTVPGYGHCPKADATIAAFQQLAGWVETGARP